MRPNTLCKVAAAVLVAFALSSCAALQQDYQENPKALLGGVLGAGAGAGIAALAGGSPGAIVGAALGGALLGGIVGHKLDDRDKKMATQAAQQAFEKNAAGTASVWNNPDSGNSGSITPTKTYQLANGRYCREYRQTITIGGEPQTSYGTACRQPDGTWQIQPS
jgi:surface antigen